MAMLIEAHNYQKEMKESSQSANTNNQVPLSSQKSEKNEQLQEEEQPAIIEQELVQEDAEIVDESEQQSEKQQEPEQVQVQQYVQEEEVQMEDVQIEEQHQEEIEEVLELPKVLSEELHLPSKMKLLLEFQSALDNAINFTLARQQMPTFSNVKAFIEQQNRRQFSISHIQQILKVVPFMYNHKWEIKFGKMELILSVPKNMNELLTDSSISPSEEAWQGSLGSIIQKRNKILKMKMLDFVVQDYQEYRMSRNEDPNDIYSMN